MKKILRLLLTILLAIALFIFNLYLVRSLFSGEYASDLGSIESQLLAQARFIRENFSNLGWMPFWYMGFPFHLIYLPVVGFTLAFANLISGLPISILYRAMTVIFYALGPVTMFLLAKKLTKNNLTSLISAVIYSVGPTAVYLISGIKYVGLESNLLPWRLIVLTRFGEGAHIWALAFLPLALLFFIKLLRKPSPLNFLGAVGFTLLTLLTSFTAFMPLVILMLIFLIAESLIGKYKDKTLLFFLVGFFVWGLSSFWFNWSFFRALMGFASPAGGGTPFQGLYGNFILFITVFFILVSLFVVFISPLFKKFKNFYLWFVSLGSFLLLFFTLLAKYKYDFSLLPLPAGYLPRIGPEVELTFALTVAVGLTILFQQFRNKLKIISILIGLAILALVSLGNISAKINSAKELTVPNQNIESESEYNISQWLKENAGISRVYATGTHAFWLNVWVDTPQLRGAGDQALTNPLWAHLTYQIYYGEDGQLATKWLKALGIKYIVVNTSASEVTYHDFQYPEKFEPYLEKVYQYQGDIIYEVPLEKSSLACSVDEDKLSESPIFRKAKEGKAVLNEEGLDKYLEATENDENSRNLSYFYNKPWNQMTIDLEDTIPNNILVRQTYDKGWKAYQGNKKLKTEPDPLGFMKITLDPNGDKIVTLKYKKTWDVWLGYGINFVFIIFFIIFLIKWPVKDVLKTEKKIKNANE